MANSFTDWESTCLAHHGIKGQKWGVRRYQNADGTLTDKGKARVAKKAGAYLPDFWNNSKDWRRLHKKDGQNRRKLSENYSEDDRPYSYEAHQAKFNRLKDKWAGATLKDLGMKDTRLGRNQVRSILKDVDPYYSYRRRYPYTDSDVYSNSDLDKFKKRRKEIIHPKRTKAKKVMKKLGKAADRLHQTSETAANFSKVVRKGG